MSGCRNTGRRLSPSGSAKLKCSYGPSESDSGLKSLSAVCDDYQQSCAWNLKKQCQSYQALPCGEEAARRAANAEIPVTEEGICSPYKAPHQYRIKGSSLIQCHDPLIQVMRDLPLARLQDEGFDYILGCVQKAIGHIHGIGELMVYDTALRLGFNLGIYPEKVYLHAGARIGAERLIGLRAKAPYICIADLPAEFQKAITKHGLVPHQVEDILCIYKDDLGEIGKGSG